MTDIKITGQPDIPWIPDDYLKSDWYMILEDIDKHIQLNHCVAVNEPNMPMGLMMHPDDLPEPKDLK